MLYTSLPEERVTAIECSAFDIVCFCDGESIAARRGNCGNSTNTILYLICSEVPLLALRQLFCGRSETAESRELLN